MSNQKTTNMREHYLLVGSVGSAHTARCYNTVDIFHGLCTRQKACLFGSLFGSYVSGKSKSRADQWMFLYLMSMHACMIPSGFELYMSLNDRTLII